MEKDSDITLTCRQCGKEFIFTKAEQEFYEGKGFTLPHRCKECRSTRQQQPPLLCSKCGNKLGEGSSIYCATCLADVQLEFELKTRRLQSAADEANAKLSAVEAEKAQFVDEANVRLSAAETENARLSGEVSAKLSIAETEKAQLAELLQQREQLTAKLQEQFNNVSLELEKALKYHAALDWLEPALNSMKERLEALERTQNSLNQATLQLIQRIGEMHESAGLLEVFRRIVRPHRKSPAAGG